MTGRQFAILGIVGGGMAVVGSLLPWATVTIGFGSLSLNGTDGDGRFTLVLGAVIALASFARYNSNVAPWVRVVVSALGILTVLLAGYDAAAVAGGNTASVGIGLFVVILGGIAAFLSGGKGKGATADTTGDAAPAPPIAAATLPDRMAALAEVASMRDRGLITAQEYDAKKAELLSRI